MKEDFAKMIKAEDLLFSVLLALSLEDYHLNHYYVYGADHQTGAIICVEEFNALDPDKVYKWLQISNSIIAMSKINRSKNRSKFL